MDALKLIHARNLYVAYTGYREALAFSDDDLMTFIFDFNSEPPSILSAIMHATERASPKILLEIRATLEELAVETRTKLEDLGVEFPPEGKDE